MFPTTRSRPADGLDDDAKLRDLGYQPVLVRRMGPFGNFAISFSPNAVVSA